jgi:hypothetical protein
MFRVHPIRVVLCTFVAVAGLALLQPSAQAAITEGKALAGAGGSACGLTISCGTFAGSCNTTANDIDASVRAAILNGPHAITFAYTGALLGTANVAAFDGSCNQIGNLFFVKSGGVVTFPLNTRWVAVWPTDRFVQFTFQLH